MTESITTPPWDADPFERDAVAGMQQMMRGMAELLHAVPEARYVDPSGGYIPLR